MHARKKWSKCLNSMESQLSNALSIIKIEQKLASVWYFKIWWIFFLTLTPKNSHKGGHFSDSRTNFKYAYRSEFLFDFDDWECVGKLRSRRIQKNKFYFMCTHQAQNRVKIANLHISAFLREKCTQEKHDILFWILRNFSFPTHIRLLKSDKNSYDNLKFDENFLFGPLLHWEFS